MTNDTFYIVHSFPVSDRTIQAEVFVAYTRFICEMIRQLIDEPLIPFNLTTYANQIDKYVNDFILHYKREYLSVSSHIGDPSKKNQFFDVASYFNLDNFVSTFNELTQIIRRIQLHIDETNENE